MFLTYKDLSELFPNSRGIRDINLPFHTISSFAEQNQHKGLFIPLSEESGELSKAIENGAIGAIWEEGKEIPKYTPNHFPIFITNDIVKGFKEMTKQYMKKIKTSETKNMDMTKFLFLEEKLLNENFKTYDIAVVEENLNLFIEQLSEERRG